jgi:hypothetical protein
VIYELLLENALQMLDTPYVKHKDFLQNGLIITISEKNKPTPSTDKTSIVQKQYS